MDSERQNHEPLNDHVSNEQKAWERGEIDFTRRDRFTVIQHHLDSTIDGRPIEVCIHLYCNGHLQGTVFILFNHNGSKVPFLSLLRNHCKKVICARSKCESCRAYCSRMPSFFVR